jgi:PAS domain S-box-containing protein
MKVLIVDDNEENRYLLETMLKGSGYDVESVENGADAFDQIKAGGIALIISDILMPVMDGFQLCRKVKTDKALCHIPFIIYTATYTGLQDQKFALKIGADRFIQKPCEPNVFMEAVREITTTTKCEKDTSTPKSAKEEEILKLYNERLVRKLEQKMLQAEREIEARQMAENALRESQTRLIEAQRIAKMGDFIWDVESGAVTWSDALYDMLKYDKSETFNYAKIKAKIHHPDDLEEITQWFDDSIASGKEELIPKEYRVVRRDGQILFVRTVGMVQLRVGKKPRIFATIQDITELKKAEVEREKLQSQLIQAQKMESVGRLAGGVAHDFNNLLTIILGYSETLLEDLSVDHPHYDPLKEIHNASIRAKNLTRQLLAFSRKQVLELLIVDLNDVVEGFERLLGRVLGEDIELVLTISVEPLPVTADTAQLEQVLMNLAVNARDAMVDGGRLNIETGRVVLDKTYANNKPDVIPGDYAMIGVSDTGCGMDKETLARIFEPFFTTKSRGKGTGLGLATSYGIIKQHGGSIWVYSEPNRGTTFKIYLPLSTQPVSTETQVEQKREIVPGSATILIVEDDTTMRGLAVNILKSGGYRVIDSVSVEDAIQKAAAYSAPLHLVLTDVVMPGMKGPEVFAKIAEHHSETKVLYMSGYTDNVIARQGVLKPGIHFLQKPFTVNSLLEKVYHVLNS